LQIQLSRAKFEELTQDLTDRMIGPFKQALADAGVSEKEMDEVVLVGGSTRIPLVYETVKKFFGKEPHKGVNPDEVVAVGAAVQAGVLAGDVKDLLLLDVTPLSLGIETMGGVMTALIPRNTTIPTRKSEIFSTASDNHTSVEVHVLQGERSLARDNRTLGKFHLIGLPPAPRGVPQIEVTFDIDANGIVNVQAKDLGTGKEQKITITASSGLSKDEVNRMMREAESHSDEDKKRREEIESRNRADQAVYGAERFIKDSGDKLPAGERQAIESATETLKKAIESGDASAINKAMEELTAAQHKAAATLYQHASSAGSGGAAPGGDGAAGQADEGRSAGKGDGKGDVIDAEVVDEGKS
jgi:molecular chaperone DnaK